MIPPHLKVHTVTVADYLGAGTYGDKWGTATDVACWLEDGVKLVTNALGQQVVSTTQVYLDVEDEPAPKSKITIASKPRTVVAVVRHTSGGLSQLDHVEVQLL